MREPVRIGLGIAFLLLSVSLYRFSFAMGYTIFGMVHPLLVLVIPACNFLFSISSVLLASGYAKRWKWIGFGAGLIPVLLATPLIMTGKVNPLGELGLIAQKVMPVRSMAQRRAPLTAASPAPSLKDTIQGRLAGLFCDREGKIRAYTAAIEASPSSAAAYSNRAFAYHQAGQMDAALADAEHAIELDPNFSRSYRLRGLVRESRGDLEGAGHDYHRALRLEPGYRNASVSLAQVAKKYEAQNGKPLIVTD